jgi:Cu/Ag efflux pump CusA
MYGVAIADPNLEILMRHRAVMFALLALLLLAAAFLPAWRAMAYAAGMASAGSFVLIAWLVGGYAAPIARVVTADVLVVAGLVCAALVDARTRRRRLGA